MSERPRTLDYQAQADTLRQALKMMNGKGVVLINSSLTIILGKPPSERDEEDEEDSNYQGSAIGFTAGEGEEDYDED